MTQLTTTKILFFEFSTQGRIGLATVKILPLDRSILMFID